MDAQELRLYRIDVAKHNQCRIREVIDSIRITLGSESAHKLTTSQRRAMEKAEKHLQKSMEIYGDAARTLLR